MLKHCAPVACDARQAMHMVQAEQGGRQRRRTHRLPQPQRLPLHAAGSPPVPSPPADDAFTRKDVIYHIEDQDVEAVAAIKAFQRKQFAAAASGPLPAPPAEAALDFTAKVERKYRAAEIVESGLQVRVQGRACAGAVWQAAAKRGGGGGVAALMHGHTG